MYSKTMVATSIFLRFLKTEMHSFSIYIRICQSEKVMSIEVNKKMHQLYNVLLKYFVLDS